MYNVRQQELLGSIEISINCEYVFYNTTFCYTRFAVLYIKYISNIHEKRGFYSLTSIEGRKSRKTKYHSTLAIVSSWNFNFYSKSVFIKISQEYQKKKKEDYINWKSNFQFILRSLTHCFNITRVKKKLYALSYIFSKESRHFGYINCKYGYKRNYFHALWYLRQRIWTFWIYKL